MHRLFSFLPASLLVFLFNWIADVVDHCEPEKYDRIMGKVWAVRR